MPNNLSDAHLTVFAFDPHAATLDEVRTMANQLQAARAEIAALRNDLDAKISDFDAAMTQLANSRRIAELEAQLGGGAR